MASSSIHEGDLSDAGADDRFYLPLKGKARHYLLRWIQVREEEECARREKRLALPNPPLSPPSKYVPGDSPLMSRLDLPLWFSQSELLKYVQDDLAEADHIGLTVAETEVLFPYRLGRYPSVTGMKRNAATAKKRKSDLRDARASTRARLH